MSEPISNKEIMTRYQASTEELRFQRQFFADRAANLAQEVATRDARIFGLQAELDNARAERDMLRAAMPQTEKESK